MGAASGRSVGVFGCCGGHVPPRYCRAMALDPQVYAQIALLLEALGETETPPVADVEARRITVTA